MRNLLLCFVLLFCINNKMLNAQTCNSDPNCSAPSCPDTAEVINVVVNKPFSKVITLNLPSTVTHPVYGTLTLDSVIINSFSNLPAGVTWATECGVTTKCNYTAGQQHCLLLSGTPTAVGTYTINLTTSPYSMGQTAQQTAHYIINVTPPPCNADANCSAPSCPDTAQVMNAVVGQSFSQTITLNLPSTVTHPVYGTLTLDSVIINSFSNLPSGITWSTECGITTKCNYTAGQQHCLLLSGTPTAVGTYTINLITSPYSMGQTAQQTAHYIISVSDKPTVTTTTVSSVTSGAASTGGDVTNDGNCTVTARGVVYSTATAPTLTNGATNLAAGAGGTGSFTSNLTGLNASTTYYVRAYATNANGTTYGNEVTFTTLAGGGPACNADPNCSAPSCPDTAQVMNAVVGQSFSQTITLNIPSSVTHPVYGALTLDSVIINSFNNLPAGITWTTECGATISCKYLPGMHCLLLSGTPTTAGTYTLNLLTSPYSMGQTAQQTAHYVISVSDKPTVTTTSASSVTSSAASTGGNVTNDGNSTVTARGVVYSTTTAPSLTNGATNVPAGSAGTGTFVSSLSGLSLSTTYYVRAYATNANGTSYGNEVIFTTLGATNTAPVITTTAASSVTITAAVTGGYVTSDGGVPVTVRGVVYSTSQNPTLATGTDVPDGSAGVGAFTSSLSGLTANTTYYVRAYATNTVGTTYGNQVTFTTMQIPSPPVLSSSTTTVSTVNSTSVKVNSGGVTNNGGSSISASGVVYSTSPSPTLGSASTVANSSGNTGTITATLTGLTPGTTYYIRTYATNSTGTTYGNEVAYTTPAGMSCTPDPSITLATPGIFPKQLPPIDTTTYTVNQTFTYSLPRTYTNEKGQTVTVDSSHLDDVMNLPAGLSFQCGRPSCMFYPNEIGCFVVSGTVPNVNGQAYSVYFKLTDYGITNTSTYGPQASQTYNPGYITDTIIFAVGSAALLGVESISDSGLLSILECSPNPFNSVANIKFNSPANGDVKFTVTDLFGRELYKTSVPAVVGINTMTYSADEITSGTYYFTIDNGVAKATKVMIVIK